jgi:hypothetical protein
MGLHGIVRDIRFVYMKYKGKMTRKIQGTAGKKNYGPLVLIKS